MSLGLRSSHASTASEPPTSRLVVGSPRPQLKRHRVWRRLEWTLAALLLVVLACAVLVMAGLLWVLWPGE